METPTLEEKKKALMQELSNKTLSFGCEILLNGGLYEYIENYDNCLIDGYEDLALREIDEGCGCCSSAESYKDFNIIGHPVYLHDVLLGLKERKIYVVCDVDGCISCFSKLEPMEITRDLSKDLLNQTSEVIDSLREIVCK